MIKELMTYSERILVDNNLNATPLLKPTIILKNLHKYQVQRINKDSV